MAKQIIVDVCFNADGSIDSEKTDSSYFQLRDRLVAQVQTDFNSVAVEITEFLLLNPGLKTIPTSTLVRSLWERRVEEGKLKDKKQEEKNELYSRLEEVVPEYVKSNGDMFHMGRKTGIAIRYVPGDYVKDAKGNTVYDAETNEVQAFRHSEEEWSKLTAAKEAKAAAKATAENGAVAA